MNELQYRVNFFVQIFESLLALGTGLVGLGLVFSHTDQLAGWSRAELLAVMGVHILMGFIVLGVALVQLETHLGIWQALGFVSALWMGGTMIYCFWLMLTTGAFWVIRMDQIVELFQGVYQAGRWPVGIYPGWLRTGLTFLVPIAFAVTVPAEALTGRLNLQTLMGAAGLTIFLLLLSRWVWKRGLRNYSGASA